MLIRPPTSYCRNPLEWCARFTQVHFSMIHLWYDLVLKVYLYEKMGNTLPLFEGLLKGLYV